MEKYEMYFVVLHGVTIKKSSWAFEEIWDFGLLNNVETEKDMGIF